MAAHGPILLSLLALIAQMRRVVDCNTIFSINSVGLLATPSLTLKNGEQLNLKCKVDFAKTTNFELTSVICFYKDDIMIHNVTTQSSEATYIIPQARVSASGYYKCKVTAESKERSSDEIQIKVTGLSKPRIILSKNEVTEGDDVTVRCEAPEEEPTMKFHFYKSIGQAKDAPKTKTTGTNFAESTFKINEGESILSFECDVILVSVDEPKSELSDRRTVTVVEPFSTPMISVHPSNNITEGTKMEVTCSVLTSHINPQEVTMTLQRGSHILTSSTSARLTHSQVASETDTGNYTCKVEGGRASKSNSTIIKVQVPVSIPELTLRPPNTYSGHNVTISCFSRNGSLPITYSLFRDMTYIEAITVTVPRSATFSITIYNSSSLGPYKCKANNSASPNGTYSTEGTIGLMNSISNLELTLIPPTTYSGHKVTIRCLSRSGSLPITYSLFRNMSYIGAKTVEVSRTRSATFNITIYNSSSLGPYKCKANNSATPNGAYSKELTFTLLEPLSNPDLTAEPSNATIGQNVTIQCQSRNGSFPITYSLYLNRITVGRTNMTEAGPAIFTLSNLSSLGPYKCKAMNNATLNGTYSQEFTFPGHDQKSDGHGQSGQTGNIWMVWAWLLLLILVIIIAALVFIMAKNRRKWRSSATPQDHNTYAAVSAAETDQRPIEKKKTPQDHIVYDAVLGPETGGCPSEAEEVQYCTLALGEGGPKVIKTEESVEYSAIARSQPQVS